MRPTFRSLFAAAAAVASLGADTLTLDPIVLSASKTEQSLKDVTSDIQIITADELEENHITSVLDALRSIALLPVAQSGGLGQQSSFFQRGFASENTVILIDGIRYNDPTTTKGQSQLEHLMIDNIDRIEILNGAQSGVWGANAAAGVINIITKKGGDKLSVNGKLEYGSYGTAKIGVDASRKIGSLSYFIGANQLYSDGFSAMSPRGDNPEHYEKDPYKNQTLNAKLSYELSDSDTLSGTLTLINAHTRYDAYAQPDSAANEIHQLNRLGSLSYRHRFSDENYVNVSYALSTFEKNDPLGYTTLFKGTNKELSLLSHLGYSENGFIVIGADTFDARNTVNNKKLYSKGIFLTNTNRFGSLILTESLRHDMYDTFNDKTTGKAGAKYLFGDTIFLSANYGTAYRVPSLYELYASYYGNPELKPETTRSFDLTFGFGGVSITYFNNTVDNLIGFDPSTYVNEQVSGKSHFKGYEIRYSQIFHEKLALSASYQKLSAKDKDKKELIRRPNESAMVSLSYYATPDLSLGTLVNYIGSRYDNDYSTYPETRVQTGRYTLLGASLNYELNPSVALYLKGENLTDKRYQEVEGYATAGRTVSAGMNARF